MTEEGYTALVQTPFNAKFLGIAPSYYRWRTLPTPSLPQPSQKKPETRVGFRKGCYGVCWNQQSDRPVPSVQRGIIPTGQSSLNRRHTSVTSSRPGCQTPGGAGCDIKHNSYDRYLNRLKGKRQGGCC